MYMRDCEPFMCSTICTLIYSFCSATFQSSYQPYWFLDTFPTTRAGYCLNCLIQTLYWLGVFPSNFGTRICEPPRESVESKRGKVVVSVTTGCCTGNSVGLKGLPGLDYSRSLTGTDGTGDSITILTIGLNCRGAIHEETSCAGALRGVEVVSFWSVEARGAQDTTGGIWCITHVIADHISDRVRKMYATVSLSLDMCADIASIAFFCKILVVARSFNWSSMEATRPCKLVNASS